MKVRGALWVSLLAVCTVQAQDAERSTARDTRVPAAVHAAVLSVG